MYSIRNRLNFTISISMIILLSLAAVFLYVRVAAQVEQVFDGALYDKVQALISLTELDEEGLEFDFAEEGVMTEFEPGVAPQYYQMWGQAAELPIKSPSLHDTDLPRARVMIGQNRYDNLLLPDGRAGRLIEITFMPRVEVEEEEEEGDIGEIQPPTPISLVFARERGSLDDTLFAIGSTIFSAVVAVLIISMLLVWYLVGTGFAPISHLTSQVSKIDESRLDRRLAHKGAQSVEIAPIENQLNYLLERLQSAFEREKRFSANAAHELRTPLSELKTLAEVGCMVPEDTAQVTAFFKDVGEISGQMEKVVITLLELARSEAGLLRSDPENIELASYCDQIWRQTVDGQSSGKKLVKLISPDLVINTDREKLGMILGNLFVNAVSYSPDDAEIQIRAEIRNDNVVLEVRNASVDLKPEDIVHMKDRFWRKQQAHAGSGHSGLGLTLVEALAKIMHLDVKLKLDKQQIFRVTISGLQPSVTAKMSRA